MNPREHHIKSIVVFAILLPLIMIGHEVSHYLVARWLGLFPHFAYDMNQFSVAPPAAVPASAPCFHLLLGLVGAVWIRRLSDAHQKPFTIWIASVLCLAGCHSLPHMIGFAFNRAKVGHIDEHQVALAMGLSAWGLHIVLWPVALGFLVWVVRFHWRHGTSLPLLTGLSVGIVSLFAFFYFWGPFVFPHRL